MQNGFFELLELEKDTSNRPSRTQRAFSRRPKSFASVPRYGMFGPTHCAKLCWGIWQRHPENSQNDGQT